MSPLAETWECSVHPDGPSTVVNGTYAGRTLDYVLENHPEFLGTRVDVNGGLPILVKLIDAEKDLSVQVHPDDEYAREHEQQNGKTEMWYVLDAKPGATLVHGFAHSVTKEQLQEAVQTGNLSKHLQKVPVHKNDLFYIPAGTVHAIGAGILLVEIQESSNVTYRVYDYDRVDKNGKKRELHFDKAVQVMNMKPGAAVRQQPRMIHYYPGCSREMLCRCKYFEVERIQVSKGFSFTVMDTSFQVILCLEGEGGLESNINNKPIRFTKGNCFFLPAGIGRCHVLGDTTLLKIRC
jgi:mannose-6-phosphate isomerase